MLRFPSAVFAKVFGLPLVDLLKRTNQVSTYRELMETQWLGENELRELRMRKLRSLLVHAQEHVPYYREMFPRCGFDAARVEDFDDLGRLPVLTKEEVRRNRSRLIADNAKDFAPRSKQTSGSTAQPLCYRASRESHSVTWASNWRAFSVVGYRPGDPLATLSGGSLVPRTSTMKQRVYGYCMGMMSFPAFHLDSEEATQIVAALRRRTDITCLFSYASTAYFLGRHLLSCRDTGPRLKAVFTTSEVLSPMQRDTIEAAFGCSAFDTYGNNESSLYAFECEAHHGLHVGTESAYLEVLDENGNAAADGEAGKLIATNLVNYAMPFIRYDTGDLGSVGLGRCSCGRGLPRLTEIVGRSRDFVVTPDGRRVHGALFSQIFYRSRWIAAWHVLQDESDHLLISLRPDGNPVDEDLKTIRDLLEKALGRDVRIDMIVDRAMFLTATGKQKVIESRIADS